MSDILSSKQQLAYDKYVAGENVFLSGPAGSGKTRLIKYIVQHANKTYKRYHVCSTTGCSTIVLQNNGIKHPSTIHSFAGVGLNELPLPLLIRKIRKSNFYRLRWENAELLIIDEVSMMSKKLLENISAIAKAVRGNDKPFGGIQVIFSGDFYQLAPVGNREDPDTCKFCFESDVFEELFGMETRVLLIRIFRQTDKTYQKMLNQVRTGKVTRSTVQKLEACVREFVPQYETDVWPIHLVPLLKTADKINRLNMNKLDTPENPLRIFNMLDIRNPDVSHRDNDFELHYLHKTIHAKEKTGLRIGTQVMHLINKKDPHDTKRLELCNGSQGVVVGFEEENGYPIVRFIKKGLGDKIEYIVRIVEPHIWTSEKHKNVSVEQLPLILAWAISIHKAQGAEMLRVIVDIGSDVFACGQTYVALSRCKSWEGLYIINLDMTRIRISRDVRLFYDKIEEYVNRKNELMN